MKPAPCARACKGLLLLRISDLVVLDTGVYDSVQIHYRFVDSSCSLCIRQLLFSINDVPPVLKIILVIVYDLIYRSHFLRDAKYLSLCTLFISPRCHSSSYFYSFYLVQVLPQ